jgi:hypothetical protein
MNRIGRLSLNAAIALITVNKVARVSLPPKPPPIRFTLHMTYVQTLKKVFLVSSTKSAFMLIRWETEFQDVINKMYNTLKHVFASICFLL